MAGVGKERLDLVTPVKLDGKPEVYLQTVLDAMQDTIYAHLIACLRVNQTPGQVQTREEKRTKGNRPDR